MKKTHSKKEYSKQDGFTLIEAMLSLFILSMVVTGPLVFIASSLQLAQLATDRTIASFLVQDAFETIRNVKDNNILDAINGNKSSADWLGEITNDDSINKCIGELCQFDHRGSLEFDTCGSSCSVMKYDKATGQYHYDSTGSSSKFTRTITIENAPNDPSGSDEVLVIVSVDWQFRGSTKTVEAVSSLYNWNN